MSPPFLGGSCSEIVGDSLCLGFSSLDSLLHTRSALGASERVVSKFTLSGSQLRILGAELKRQCQHDTIHSSNHEPPDVDLWQRFEDVRLVVRKFGEKMELDVAVKKLNESIDLKQICDGIIDIGQNYFFASLKNNTCAAAATSLSSSTTLLPPPQPDHHFVGLWSTDAVVQLQTELLGITPARAARNSFPVFCLTDIADSTCQRPLGS